MILKYKYWECLPFTRTFFSFWNSPICVSKSFSVLCKRLYQRKFISLTLARSTLPVYQFYAIVIEPSSKQRVCKNKRWKSPPETEIYGFLAYKEAKYSVLPIILCGFSSSIQWFHLFYMIFSNFVWLFGNFHHMFLHTFY